MFGRAVSRFSQSAPSRLLVLAAAHAAAYELGFRFFSPEERVSTVWPASGVALGLLILTPRGTRAASFAVLWLVAFVSNLAMTNSPAASAGYAAANCLEVMLALSLVSRRGEAAELSSRVQRVAVFVAAAITAPALAALLGAATSHWVFGASFPDAYRTWLTADALGLLLLTPFIVSFARQQEPTDLWRLRRREAALFGLAWIGAAGLVFWYDASGLPAGTRSLALLGLLLWGVLRLGQRGGAFGLLALGFVAIGAALGGTEVSLWDGQSPSSRLLIAQIYVAAAAITSLFLGASLKEGEQLALESAEGRSRFREAEDAARRNEARLKLALQAASVGTWEWEIASNRVFWSDQVEPIFGLAKGEFPGTFEAYVALLHPEDRDAVLARIEATLSGKQAGYLVEHRVNFPDGTPHWIEGKGNVELGDDGKPLRMVGTVVDITARRHAEEALRDANRALRTLGSCGQVLVHARVEDELLRDVCRVIVDDSGYRMAWVGFARNDAARRVEIVAHFGDSRDFLSHAPISWSDATEIGRGPVGIAIRSCEPALCADLASEPNVASWRDNALGEGCQSLLVVPLLSEDTAFGVLAVYSAKRDAFDTAQIELLSELANDLAFGIQALRARAAHEKAQQELVAGESLLRQFIKHTPAAVAMFDRDMRYLYAAERWLSDYHLQEQDIIGKSHYEVFPDIPERWKQVHQRVLAGAVERCDEDPFPREDGKLDWLQWEVRPWRNVDGEVGGLTMFTQVITERKRAEQAARQNEARFRRLIENASDMITVLDREGRIRFQSPSSLRVLGFTPDELLGRSAFDWVHPDELALATGTLAQAASSQSTPVRLKARFRHKDGSWRLVESIGVAMPDDAGEGDIVLNSRDITESTALQAQLREAQKLDALGTLAGGIAHDFNNILSAIIAFIELGRLDNPDNAELQENLGEALLATERATNLVKQILSFSRRQPQQRHVASLTPVVNEALRLLRSTLPATVEIVREVEPELPGALVDPTQMHQVVMNLCTNAAQAMKGRGQLWLRLDTYQLSASSPAPHVDLRAGDYLRLRVRDSGEGMDNAVLGRIFEPFFTTKRPGEGTGLGLAVVHGIVKEHDGVITVHSEVGKGTLVTVYLPVLPAEAQQESLDLSDTPNGNGERVLFVDDETAIGDVAGRLLSRLGYRPSVYANPELALQAVRATPQAFALVVTDLTMPGMTGVELTIELSKLNPRLPVILTSGHTGTLRIDALEEFGVREVVHKPLDYRFLARAIARALETPDTFVEARSAS